MTAWHTSVHVESGLGEQKDHPNERVALRYLRELIEVKGEVYIAMYPISDQEWEKSEWREMNRRTGVGDVDTLNWPKAQSPEPSR